MKKNSFYYFKIAFIGSVPIATGIIVYELLGLVNMDVSKVLMIFAKGLFVGVFTGIVLGAINVFAKIDSFKRKT